MLENVVMERKKQIFLVDARLKEMFNAYCSGRAMIQEQILEAMVFFLVIKDGLKPEARDKLLRECAEWKEKGV